MKNPILIVGLGNPGRKFKDTRHNVGFEIADKIGTGAFAKNPKFEAELYKFSESITVIKPQTFMNLSGQSVAKFVNFYKISPKNIWVIHDDIDLPIGTIRVRIGGSSGGHKGVQSIIDSLDTDNFCRFRVGIYTEDALKFGTENFVLAKFGPSELVTIEQSYIECLHVLEESIRIGVPKEITIKKN